MKDESYLDDITVVKSFLYCVIIKISCTHDKTFPLSKSRIKPEVQDFKFKVYFLSYLWLHHLQLTSICEKQIER